MSSDWENSDGLWKVSLHLEHIPTKSLCRDEKVWLEYLLLLEKFWDYEVDHFKAMCFMLEKDYGLMCKDCWNY